MFRKLNQFPSAIITFVMFAVAIFIKSSNGAPTIIKRDQFSGDGTYYNPGLGACGETNSEGDLIVAINKPQWGNPSNPNNNPICGKQVQVSGPKGSVIATIKDECPECAYGSLDFSPAAFDKIADRSAGRVHITWDFYGGGSGGSDSAAHSSDSTPATQTTTTATQTTTTVTPSSSASTTHTTTTVTPSSSPSTTHTTTTVIPSSSPSATQTTTTITQSSSLVLKTPTATVTINSSNSHPALPNLVPQKKPPQKKPPQKKPTQKKSPQKKLPPKKPPPKKLTPKNSSSKKSTPKKSNK
ncbi:hypothetical protein G9A89_010117 [Geosiphon pyriformis]|nr:hypothetical protein G9A89_010117 [Geosiphon pyriformis]